MSQEDIAISVKHVSKSFKLPHEKTSSVKGAFIGTFRGRRTYEKQQVLHDISFDIKKGEFFGIVGRNGSGSTLLKLLAGIYSPDKGHIQINGKLTPFIELGVGFNPELTGRENVFLNGALLGFTREEVESMYDEIVGFAELEKFMDQKLKNYSSGMQVRLAFSVAIRAQPEILVLDEVLAVGDEAFQKKCKQYFLKLKQNKQTVILVTHDMQNIESFCDRTLVIDYGKQIGIYDTYNAQKVYSQLNRSQVQSMDNSLNEVASRWGTKKITLESITINDLNDEIPIAEQGKNLNITLKINNNNDRELPFIVGLGFYDQTQTYISGPNSKGIRFKDNQTIDFSVPRNPLNPGVYRIEVAIFSEDLVEEYDHMINAIEFEVISTENIKHYGKITMFGKWSSNK